MIPWRELSGRGGHDATDRPPLLVFDLPVELLLGRDRDVGVGALFKVKQCDIDSDDEVELAKVRRSITLLRNMHSTDDARSGSLTICCQVLVGANADRFGLDVVTEHRKAKSGGHGMAFGATAAAGTDASHQLWQITFTSDRADR
jgi:hypothetical protein